MDIKKEILELINNPDKNISFKSCIIIFGKSGIGKTYTINKICNELNIEIINITSNNVSTSNDLEDILFKSVTVINFLDIISNKENKKKLVLIDNYESILSIDRTINNTLLNILNSKKNKNISIICICNNDLLKKLGNIKKKCKIIEFNEPTNEDIGKILINKKPDINKIVKNNILKKSNNNIQQALYFLENYKFNNNDMIDKNYKFNNNDMIDKNYNIEYLYGYEYNRTIVHKLLISESWLVPLRFHENLIIELKNRRVNNNIKNDYYKSFIFDFCLFDLLMNNNFIYDAISIITSHVYFLTLLPSKKLNNSNLANFTKLLSYLSLQKKNIKKGFNVNNHFYQIGNYHINSININLYS